MILAGIIFLLLLLYVVNTQSPWDLQQVDGVLERYSITTNEEFSAFIDDSVRLGQIWTLIDEKNLSVMLLMLGGGVICIVAGVHMVLDKLFVKRFYEKPDMRYAVRRGVLLYLFLVGLLLLKFIGGLLWYNALAILVLVIAVEYAFSSGNRVRTETRTDNA
ncbi:MAG: hypothetical protein TR69_WS6001000924 [candidate division WS6 bacterium OLB20]|uniref:Uncharacterized protein n=1 Tax=candidate division WS6 bacterium OLB20 TaxID=1617426 RepID=A0A136LZ30_9BACT|nr:MAG: hypothetical protein TR69_WS6001000924 [candidate division WS6 bacterium OLB20]